MAHDPQAVENVKRVYADRSDILEKIFFVEDKYDALYEADMLVIVTEWDEYLHMDFDLAREQMQSFCIVDGRNCFDLEHMKTLGCRYVSIGRREIIA